MGCCTISDLLDETFSFNAGAIDPSCVLEQIETQIAQVKEEAYSRKEILEKFEKWLAACEEESWLEEYNRVWPFSIFVNKFCLSFTYLIFLHVH